MDNFNFLDKINMPIYVCDGEWRIVFRNRACKKYTRTPRVNGNLSSYFIDKKGTDFPKENGGIEFISCLLEENYRTALCFEYNSSAVVIFPSILEYDLLFGDYSSRVKKDFAKTLCSVLELLSSSENNNRDKYGTVEKLRSYYFGAIESYVALALFDTEKRVLGSLARIYGFFLKNMINIANKSGYRIETDMSQLDEIGENIYTDTLYFTLVLSGLLLFGLEISDNRKCIITPAHLGTSVRHAVRFTCKRSDLYGKSGEGLKIFMETFPGEYLNVIPYEALCPALCWRLHYDITDDEEWNCTICFDIDNDNDILFRSADTGRAIKPEEIIADVIYNVFLAM